MSKASSIKQIVKVGTVLLDNVSDEFIEGFTTEQAQSIIGDPVRAGQEYMQFLRNGARVNDASVLHQATAAVPTKKSPLVLLKTVELPAFGEKLTAECLAGTYYGYRDSDIDSWLAKTQLACVTAKIGVFKRTKRQTFADMFRAGLKLPPDASLDEIEKRLKEGGHVVALQHAAALVEMQEGGEDVGFRTDGYGNFAPILDKNGNVCVLFVDHFGRWERRVDGLGRGLVWRPEGRLFLSNSDAVTL